MKIDRREFLKTATVMGMFLPISEVYGSVSQRHVHRGSDACTPDVKYLPDMGGAMMMDNVGWPSSMWGWLPLPPDPVVVGDRWKEMWRERIRNMTFWFEQWGGSPCA